MALHLTERLIVAQFKLSADSSGVDITVFEVLKDVLLDYYQGQQPPTSSILLVGMLSSSVAQFVSYPLAVVRTRMQ
eukprot:scaffold659599_cov57-Prasinocladus_malaysianus.AAC.1